MIEHFEALWERSEVVAEKYYEQPRFNIYDVLDELQENLILLRRYEKTKVDNYKTAELMGKILFNLTYISKTKNINTHLALKDVIEDLKIEMLDPEIDNMGV